MPKGEAKRMESKIRRRITIEFRILTTLTIDQDHIKKLEEDTDLKWKENPNEIASKALRFFLERARKETGKSIRHWCVTELGEQNDRIHLHGI